MADLVLSILLFGVGLGLLVKGADWLVDSAARIAKQLGVSEFVIGLTIVAIGTSIPELGATTTAMFFGNTELAIGDIIGSNIVNIALILGLAGVFTKISVSKEIYNREGFVLLAVTILFYLFCLNGILSRFEGMIFLILFSAYILYFVATKKPYKRQFHFKQYLREYADLKGRERFEKAPSLVANVEHGLSTEVLAQAFFAVRRIVTNVNEALVQEVKAARFFFKQIVFALLGVAAIFVGAQLLVFGAMALPVNQVVVGLVFVAIGTSLPELAVTITSLRRGLPAIMIGNLIGSNISNILLVSGIATLISPLEIPAAVIGFDLIFLLLVTWLFLVFMRNDYKITKIEAFSMLIMYFIFLGLLLVMHTGV